MTCPTGVSEPPNGETQSVNRPPGNPPRPNPPRPNPPRPNQPRPNQPCPNRPRRSNSNSGQGQGRHNANRCQNNAASGSRTRVSRAIRDVYEPFDNSHHFAYTMAHLKPRLPYNYKALGWGLWGVSLAACAVSIAISLVELFQCRAAIEPWDAVDEVHWLCAPLDDPAYVSSVAAFLLLVGACCLGRLGKGFVLLAAGVAVGVIAGSYCPGASCLSTATALTNRLVERVQRCRHHLEHRDQYDYFPLYARYPPAPEIPRSLRESDSRGSCQNLTDYLVSLCRRDGKTVNQFQVKDCASHVGMSFEDVCNQFDDVFLPLFLATMAVFLAIGIVFMILGGCERERATRYDSLVGSTLEIFRQQRADPTNSLYQLAPRSSSANQPAPASSRRSQSTTASSSRSQSAPRSSSLGQSEPSEQRTAIWRFVATFKRLCVTRCLTGCPTLRRSNARDPPPASGQLSSVVTVPLPQLAGREGAGSGPEVQGKETAPIRAPLQAASCLPHAENGKLVEDVV